MIKNSILALALAALTLPLRAGIPWDQTDLGPFQTGCFRVNNQITAKGIAIKVGDKEHPATVLFDPELLRISAAWTGGFIKFPGGRGGLEGQIAPGGEVKFSTPYLPGWSAGDIGDDPREKHQGHLPADVAKYRGLYLHGDQVILSFSVGKTSGLELAGAEVKDGALILTRTIALGAGPAVTMLVGSGEVPATVDGLPSAKVEKTADGKTVVRVPARAQATTFRVFIAPGAAQAPEASKAALPDLVALCKGGPAHWGQALETQGKLGAGDGPYLMDEITAPDNNPYKSWLRFGGHDFFPNGDAAVVNVSGDVWVVSGLDDKLEHVKWKRVATGLFQPLGCKVVDGKIYVLGRDQITRLHDLNGDGEADFYECFNNDCIVTENYHEFALDLQTDSAGNFYYAKGSPWEPSVMSPHQGTMIRVSKDGAKFEIIATGLRAPNGLGMSPKDVLSFSDNQGHWMPSNRVNLVKPGGFYGMVPAAHKVLTFKKPDGTTFEANPSEESARQTYHTKFWGGGSPIPTGDDPPLCWTLYSADNSTGGQAWVTSDKWGPIKGQMLCTTYGKCALFLVMQETVDGVAQGGMMRFPFKFTSGVMRARFSPKDGQLYLTGLNVWQSDASKFGCFTRVRYNGTTVTMPAELHALKTGMQIKFTALLDEKSATDPGNYSVERWNYLWTGNYGSDDWKVSNPKQKGRDKVEIEKIALSPDKKTVTLTLPDMVPCMQMAIKYKITAADGKTVEQEIDNTINRVPGMSAAR